LSLNEIKLNFRGENGQALKIALYFAIIGMLWIYGSDLFVEQIHKNSVSYRFIQTSKGFFFVIVVSLIIYFLVRKLLIRINKNNASIASSEKRLRNTLDNMLEGCQIVDFNWTYIYLNEVAAQHGKKTKEELLGSTIMESYPGIESTEIFKQLSRCMTERKSHRMQSKFYFQDGTFSWFDLSIEPVLGGIFILSYDITKRKNAELALIDSSERLIEAQRIARLGDFTWKYNTGEVTWSEALYELLGYEKNEDVDYETVRREIHHPEDVDSIDEWLQYTIESKNPVLEAKEYRIVKKDRSVIYVRTSGVVDYSQPDFPVVFATIQDINERKLAGLELVKKNKELKSTLQRIEQINLDLEKAKQKAEISDKLKSAFLENMSHEIRTPLNGIIGFSELMIKNDDLSTEEKFKYTAIIKKCSSGLLQIVNDILDISALESGNFQLREKPFEVKQILEDIFELYKTRITESEKNVLLKLKPALSNIILDTDEDRLRQILINLMDNAVKYTYVGSIEFGIYEFDNSHVTFFVKDTGTGIRKEYHQLIFNRFMQVGKSRRKPHGGNGLGLSIVKELLKLMKGDIWLDSEVGQGTAFYFSLPHANMLKFTENNNGEGTGLFKLRKGLHILIVEDDKINMMYLKELLIDFEPVFGETQFGNEALELVKKKPFDIIFMDIRLPDMDGLEVVREIRKFDKTTPIIAQTAYAMTSDEEKSLRAGCNAYISKPIKKSVLFDKIKGLSKF
jgi:PAS domain S-box-containing protein